MRHRKPLSPLNLAVSTVLLRFFIFPWLWLWMQGFLFVDRIVMRQAKKELAESLAEIELEFY